MIFSLGNVIHWLLVYKYFILLPAATVEGPIVTVLAGFLASLGILNLYAVYVIVIMGDFLGDLLYYAIGAFTKKSFITRYGHYVGVTPAKIASLDKHFEKHTGRILLFGKFSHVFGLPTLIAAGMTRINLGRFLLFTIIGTIPKSLIFILIGYFFGSSYVAINHYIDYGSYAALLVGVILIILYYIFSKISTKYL